MAFPDPKEFCLGFIVKDIEVGSTSKLEELKMSGASQIPNNRYQDD